MRYCRAGYSRNELRFFLDDYCMFCFGADYEASGVVKEDDRCVSKTIVSDGKLGIGR